MHAINFVHIYMLLGMWLYILTFIMLIFLIFYPLEVCLATAIHNFKWLKITHICLIWA